ncbi:3-dehydroquinate synthase [Pelagirhabdus alkalitolerans]|uniref:3-dehydroquinate synthase n=1 Tax=Pelagirhabdus alkalitolerans TaxID=1612202 RepID=A0A1G6HAJ3_9BACI|nr:3-dehydroquinate synthase [Pelagirhabdus alkalitolerans]SDB91290.1 3-dehydroquinate synthase [Pelagirhabdus alkalitolerans]
MKSIQVMTKDGAYDVNVDSELRFRLHELLPKSYRKVFVITDSTVGPLYLDDVLTELRKVSEVDYSIVPAGEGSKSSRFYFNLMTEIINAGLDRDSLIVALGGGMIGDLAGFVASTYMRGIDFIQMPTTILAHDSSVGGKVAINHPEGKNLIGSFYQPKAVLYDVDTLHTLPLREIRSGYAEIVKHSLIHPTPFWDQLKSLNLNQPLDNERLVSDLINGIHVKREIVQQDEFEQNVRQYLNFGHTLGHAIEAERGYGHITHGEAVAIGMLFALRVSEQHFNIQLPFDELYRWFKQNNYPFDVSDLSVTRLITRMKKDKKAKNSAIQMVLLKQLGECTSVRLEDNDVTLWLETFMRELVNN